MTLDSRFKIDAPKVIHEAFDDEVIVINLENGRYYSLDQVAVRVWECLGHGMSLARIVAEIAGTYAGSTLNIEQSIRTFLDELQQESLICSDDSPPDESPPPVPPSQRDLPVFQAPSLCKYTDMEELLLVDPIHEVDEKGWPSIR